jgi:uncharacterized small protein (DUF1192 family)
MENRQIDTGKAVQIAQLTMEIKRLRAEVKDYAKPRRKEIKELEKSITALTEEINQTSLPFEGS